MDYILASKKSIPSARLLRDVFSEHGLQLFVTSEPRKKAPVIRYGNCAGSYLNDISLNTVSFIQLLSNKKTFADLLLSNQINAPLFSRETPNEEDFPIVVRQYMNSCKGKGIIICRNLQEWLPNRGNFWTRWVPVSNEFRVHIIGGNPVKIFRKVLLDGVERDEFPIRTSEKYHFSLVADCEKFPKLNEILGKVKNVLGTENFYALDIGWNNTEKEWFIFEGNSAPGLNEQTANLYSNFIHGHKLGGA